MNNRFKFRGITKGKVNEFVYGSLLWYAGEPQIWEKDGKNYIVNPETIGQCTGLKDKNGKLIYKGDIVKFQHGNQYRIGAVEVYKCVWSVSNSNFCQGAWCGGALINLYETCEVIGNIYENKELLECQK